MNPPEYLSTLFSLNGRVAVVIGGTGELAGAMAEALAGAGAEVVLVGRNEGKAKARLEKIHAQGGKAYFLPADADKKSEMEALLAAVLSRSKRVAVLEIHWPTSGTTQVFRDVPADQAIEVTEFATSYRPLNWKPLPQPE